MNKQDLISLWVRLDQTFARGKAVESEPDLAWDVLQEYVEKGRELEHPERLYVEFEQFVIASISLHYSQGLNEVSRMGDWIQWSLADSPIRSFVQEMNIGRMAEFHRHPEIRGWPGFTPVNVLFFNGLFDYARRRTAIKSICDALRPYAARTFLRLMSQPPAIIDMQEIMLGCLMMTWAAKESLDRAERMTPFIEELVSRQELQAEQRYLFCLTLATNAGRFSSRDKIYWATRTLTEFGPHLSGLYQAQMMATTLRVDEHGPSDAEALLAQMALVRAERNQGLSGVDATRDSGQTVEYVAPYFVRTLAMGEAGLLLRGLQTWYQQDHPTDPLNSLDVLITVPFGETGTTLLCGGEKREYERDTQAPLVDVSRSMNEFLGTYATVAYADNSSLPIPERPGMPQERQPGLSSALRNAYCPDNVVVPGAPTCQLILPAECHPIQAVQLENWGRTWPIASSLGRPREDRVPRSVLIWGGGTITEPMELEMVRYAFEKIGATVRSVTLETCTPADFLAEYQNAEYDVFWIASHGEFDHWAPHDVRLHLAPDNSAVKLEDVWDRIPSFEGRRLLVLNVCDGARFAERGMLPRVGLGPGLAGPAQATISHLWPVRPYPSAGFGASLAYYVANGVRYFEAFERTLRAIAKPAANVGMELEDMYGREFELTTRLRNQEEDFSAIEVWGSAAFFQ
ncbi:CHAT domain-containing protein [Cupriavidus sp. CuC1]|uniref:CHAT domain-containing protein n=1 Tax=Cupriavidus sp. CuC1 TaxID=3373131 RepID=UPI0037D27F8D